MDSLKKVKIKKKMSWLVSNPDFFLNCLYLNWPYIPNHKDVVNLIKDSGSQILVVHAKYNELTPIFLAVFSTCMKIIYIWDQISWAF